MSIKMMTTISMASARIERYQISIKFTRIDIDQNQNQNQIGVIIYRFE